jgi:hypothetical protein
MRHSSQHAFDRVLDGYRKGFLDKAKTINVIGQIHRDLPHVEAVELFGILTNLFQTSDMVRRQAGGFMVNEAELAVSCLAEFYPPEQLTELVFSQLQTSDEQRIEKWAQLIAPEFQWNLTRCAQRFSGEALNQIKAQITLVRNTIPPYSANVLFAMDSLERTAEFIEFQRFQASLPGAVAEVQTADGSLEEPPLRKVSRPMTESEEVFISYSHDSAEHIKRVLELSNRLRSEGVDCALDQYEVSPPEGWPRWMEKKLANAKYVVLICTEAYLRRVMGKEEEGKGNGVRWEGNLVYQHLYNAGTQSNRFIPVIFDEAHNCYIPVPLQGASRYCLATEAGYDGLYRVLTNQPKVLKPKLGKRRALPKKEVKTNPSLFISSPIDVDLWNAAEWWATFFVHEPGKPPVLGLAFRNELPARKIFEAWHERYGNNDKYEELRISIIEGPIKGEGDGYSVHVGSDLDAAAKRFKEAGYDFNDDLLFFISRINRMNPSPGSTNLQLFKEQYREYKTYLLAPGVMLNDGNPPKPLFELGIRKGKIHFRHASEISKNDIDSAVFHRGEVEK